VKIATDLADFSKGLESLGQKLEKTGKDLTTKITLPITALGVGIAKIGMDFETQMSKVSAISGATSTDIAKLTEKAKEMGSTTSFSATQTGEAFEYMAMAGWDAGQMIDGIGGMMSLAAASGENLGLVSDIVTDSLTAFGMTASDSGRFADVFAQASSNSNTSVAMMGETFKYVGPLAGALGYTLEDTALATGLLANAGIKGSQAGTTLRTAMANLITPSDSVKASMNLLNIEMLDIDGNIKPLGQTLDELRSSFSDLTEEQKIQHAESIAGKEGMSGLLAIVNASEQDYNKLSYAIDNSAGAAKRMADEMQNNLQGKFTVLKSAIEGVALQFYDVLKPKIESVVLTIQNFVDYLGTLDDGTIKTIINIGLFAASIGPVILTISKIIGFIGTLSTVVSGVSTAVTFVSTSIATLSGSAGVIGSIVTALSGPIGWAIAGIGLIVAGGVVWYKQMQKELLPAVEHFGEGVSETTKQATEGFLQMNDEVTASLAELSISGKEVTEEMKDSIVGNISQMAYETKVALEETKHSALESLNTLFADSTSISEEEKQAILLSTKEMYDEKIVKITEAEAEIVAIVELASQEKRKTSDEENEIIARNQKFIATEGIKSLTDSEREQKIILEKMKQNSDIITAQQSAQAVKNSIEQKEKVIKEAEEEYEKTLGLIIQSRDELGTISEETADKLIADAQRQKEETVKNAEQMHVDIVNEAKLQAGEHIDTIDFETGEMKTKWDKFKEDQKQLWSDIYKNTTEWLSKNYKMIIDKITETISWVLNSIDNMKTSISTKFNEVVTIVSDKLNSIEDMFRALPGKALDWGKNMIGGFIDGIRSMAGSVGDAVQGVIGGVKDFMGFNSPSKKGEGRNIVKWGYNMVDGFVDGIVSAKGLLDNTLNDFIPEMGKTASFNIESQLKTIGNNANNNDNNNNQTSPTTTQIILSELFKGAELLIRNEQDITELAKIIVKKLEEASKQGNRTYGLDVL
jgi:TP901 family phage tail tape measure protein